MMKFGNSIYKTFGKDEIIDVIRDAVHPEGHRLDGPNSISRFTPEEERKKSDDYFAQYNITKYWGDLFSYFRTDTGVVKVSRFANDISTYTSYAYEAYYVDWCEGKGIDPHDIDIDDYLIFKMEHHG